MSEGYKPSGRGVEYLSALSAFLWLSEGCKPSDTRVEWLRHSGLAEWMLCLWVRCWLGRGGTCPRRYVRGLQTLGEMCGVPIGTLLDCGDIRGLQTLGYSCGVASPLCLRRVGRVCLRAWLACGVVRCVLAGVSEGCEDPREMCGVPIGTLLWSGYIRGLRTLGYSCGVASPLCFWRIACACGGGRVERLRHYGLAGGCQPCGCVSPLACPRVARILGWRV